MKSEQQFEVEQAVQTAAQQGAGHIAQLEAALAAQQGGPQLNIPTQTSGVNWERSIFHCLGCVTQNQQLLDGWTTSSKDKWKRECMTNFENKAKENMRRKLRLVNCGIKSEQIDNFITNFVAFGQIFAAVIKFSELFWNFSSKPSMASGDQALEISTKIRTEMEQNMAAARVWKTGEPVPAAIDEMTQELKLSYTSRQRQFSAKALMMHVDRQVCNSMFCKSKIDKFPTEFPEFVSPANRQESMLRAYYQPGAAQHRLWRNALSNVAQHVSPDAPTTKFILFTFFKANFPELNAIVCDDPSKPVPEPDAKCQRTDECPAEVEQQELEGDEADDDSNFDDVDTKEFDQQFLSPEDAAALDTVRPLIAEAAVEDSKMVMALVLPFAFPVPVLAKAVDMTSVPEGAAAHSLPRTPPTPLVKVLMTKWDSFKGLAKLAAVTHKSIAAFNQWKDDNASTWAALHNFYKETSEIFSQSADDGAPVAEPISEYLEACNAKRRPETL